MKLFLLTQSPFKIQTAQQALADYDVTIEPLKVDIPEIQAASSLEVARYTAERAAAQLQVPVVREDHAFHIPALGGIPGPYMSYIERTLSPAKVLQMMEGEEDRSAYFELGLVFVDPQTNQTHEFVHTVPLTIVSELRGDMPELALGEDQYSAGWSPIMRIVGEEKTFAEAPAEERFHHFTANFKKLGELLQKGNS